MLACWNRGIIVAKVLSVWENSLANWINSSDITLQSVQVSNYVNYLAFLSTLTSANLVRVNLTRLKKTGLRVSTSHERHVLAGSAKVFGLSVALFLRLFSSHWLASRLFSHAVECNDSFIQDVRLTRGCLKSPSTSTDLRFFLFRPPDLNSKWSVVYTARISDANLKDLLEWSTSKHNVTFVKLSTCWKVLIDDWFKESWCSLTFGLI